LRYSDGGHSSNYVKPRSSQVNGKVERWKRSDEQEFYQLLTKRGVRRKRTLDGFR